MKRKNGIHVALLSVLAAYAQGALACHAGPTPIETLVRPIFKSAPLVSIASKSNAFAGRTTLASGSSTVVVSTNIVNSDSLIGMHVQAALVAAFATQGRIDIASGLATGTASTPAVYSGDVINPSWESPNNITSGMSLRVNSIVDGVSFALTTGNGLTVQASGAVAMWKIHGKDAQGIKVNTISPGGHFIVGWADGVARPFNSTIMWEIRRTT